MKNETAHRNVLSIIMGEKDLELKEVHVEEVILNRSGQRAIRLDARATDISGRNFATEMQNDTEQDDICLLYTSIQKMSLFTIQASI